jgi:manganese efflux pump family protein
MVLDILLIAFSISLDVAVVTVGAGALSRVTYLAALRIAVLFGVFHAVMPLLGFELAGLFGSAFADYGRLISFVLLMIVGLKMLKEAFGGENTERERDILKFRTLIVLAFATSIDAFVIGITFSFLSYPINQAVLIIGAVTVLMALLGTFIGHKSRHLLGTKVDALGGIILILLAFKVLLF